MIKQLAKDIVGIMTVGILTVLTTVAYSTIVQVF